ncbi:MAG: glycosyltransferase family protein [Acidimicrobiia bacterium]|nr:glycosyltransferase family protein [Acidimicrobiia bacterium]
MRTIAIVQARAGSARLPRKVLRPLAGRPVLDWVVRAARTATLVDEVVVATTAEDSDDDTVACAAACGAHTVRGSTDDVLARFVQVLDEVQADVVVRVTGDSPLLDPTVLDQAIGAFVAGDLDYLSTNRPASLPLGVGVEVVSAASLRRLEPVARGVERVHVTPHFYLHPDQHRTASLVFQPDASDLRVTLDTADDAVLIEAIVAELGDSAPSWRQIVSLLRARPELVAINAHVRQKELDEG